MSETYRQLSGGATVVLDALNLISGYRYQLHCYAREHQTSFALVRHEQPTHTPPTK